MALYARVPMERVGVLIGNEGATKRRLEEASQSRIEINSETGDVTIYEGSEDPSLALKVRDVVTAIGRGFSEERAQRLFDVDVYLRILDIKDYARSRNRVVELKGRVIGTRGKTRQLIEEMTGAELSVFGHTVAIIGDPLLLDIAVRAVEMILQGSEHAAVYRYLEKMRDQVRIAEMGF